MAAPRDVGTQAIIAFDIGLGFMVQEQRLRGIKRRPIDCLAIDQSVQKVQHMGLGRHTCCQGHFHRSQHGLLIVMQDQRQDVDHLSVATGRRSIWSCNCLNGIGISRNGAPLRNAPGLRWIEPLPAIGPKTMARGKVA